MRQVVNGSQRILNYSNRRTSDFWHMTEDAVRLSACLDGLHSVREGWAHQKLGIVDEEMKWANVLETWSQSLLD